MMRCETCGLGFIGSIRAARAAGWEPSKGWARTAREPVTKGERWLCSRCLDALLGDLLVELERYAGRAPR